MQLSERLGRVRLMVLVSVAACACCPTLARADEPVRWKFKQGEKLNYNMVQDMTMTMSGATVGQMSTSMQQKMDMTWDVQGVNDQGEAVIRQKFARVQMKMTGPAGQGFEYDSNSEAAPTGLAAMIAPMYQAMTKGDFEITMTARGEVKDVKIPEEVLAALKNSPGAAMMGDLATPEGFQKMLMQGALVLPENAPAKGEQWSTKLEMNNPQAGKQIVETTYTFDGTKEVDGTTFAIFKPNLKMTFEGNEMMQMKVKEQSSEGEILFDMTAGRLSSSTLKQKVDMDVTVAGQQLQQKLDQKIDVKVTPAGEKKDEAPKEAAEESKAK